MSAPDRPDTPAPKTTRPPGRPRSAVPMTSVSTWIPADCHDRLIQLAAEKRKTVSTVIREIIEQMS